MCKEGIVPNLLSTLKKCCDKYDANPVLNGLIVTDNICGTDEGKKEVKEADTPNVLRDVVENS